MNTDWTPTMCQTLIGTQHWGKEHNPCPYVIYIPVGKERQTKYRGGQIPRSATQKYIQL